MGKVRKGRKTFKKKQKFERKEIVDETLEEDFSEDEMLVASATSESEDLDQMSEDISDVEKEFSSKVQELNEENFDIWKQNADIKSRVEAFYSVAFKESEELLPYSVSDEVHDSLIIFSLGTLNNDLKEGMNSVMLSEEYKKKLKSQIKLFLQSVLKFLEDSTDITLKKACLNNLDLLLLSPYPKMMKRYLDHAINLWSTECLDICVIVISRIVRLQESRYPYVLKVMYQKFLKSCKTVTSFNHTKVHQLITSLCEIYNFDTEKSYHFAFKYLRNMAVLLRNALIHKSADHFRKVYSWQFICCVRFYSTLLSSRKLDLLIYPFIQVTLGALGLQESAKYHPYHFHCIAALLQVAKQTQTWIPLAIPILDILQSCKRSQKSSLRAIDFRISIKVANNYLNTRVYNESVQEECLYLLTCYLASISSSPAFPEISHPIRISLKKFLKVNKNPKLKSPVQSLLTHMQEQSDHSLEMNRDSKDGPLVEFFVNYEKLRAQKESLVLKENLMEQSEEKTDKEYSENRKESKVKLMKPEQETILHATPNEDDLVEDFYLSDAE